MGWGTFGQIFSETTLRESIDLAGYNLIVISHPRSEACYTYDVFGVRKVVSFSEFLPLPNMEEVAAITAKLAEFKKLLDFKFKGIAVGKYFAPTYMR